MIEKIPPLVCFIAQRTQQQPSGIPGFGQPLFEGGFQLLFEARRPLGIGTGILGFPPLSMCGKGRIN
jgi:hypothetical protein